MRKIDKDIIQVFAECDFCHELVPADAYCSRCGKRQLSEIQIKTINFTQQIKCNSCGKIVLKDMHCSSCGFLFFRPTIGQGMSYSSKKDILEPLSTQVSQKEFTSTKHKK